MEATLEESVKNWKRFGEGCLGQALYRHRSFFQNPSETPAWSHTELSYFRSMVPEAAMLDLVASTPPAQVELLRAELLLTTPGSFILPSYWQGMPDRSERVASLEFIQVRPPHFDQYRSIMRDYCGPAAARIVRAGKFGTFRAMETAAVLFCGSAALPEWNQIHLCELNPDGFDGFGREFEAALQDDSADRADTSGVFSGIDRLRSVPRWTFNDPVIEMDEALAQAGKAEI
jgi:hypothetical protein